MQMLSAFHILAVPLDHPHIALCLKAGVRAEGTDSCGCIGPLQVPPSNPYMQVADQNGSGPPMKAQGMMGPPPPRAMGPPPPRPGTELHNKGNNPVIQPCAVLESARARCTHVQTDTLNNAKFSSTTCGAPAVHHAAAHTCRLTVCHLIAAQVIDKLPADTLQCCCDHCSGLLRSPAVETAISSVLTLSVLQHKNLLADLHVHTLPLTACVRVCLCMVDLDAFQAGADMMCACLILHESCPRFQKQQGLMLTACVRDFVWCVRTWDALVLTACVPVRPRLDQPGGAVRNAGGSALGGLVDYADDE